MGDDVSDWGSDFDDDVDEGTVQVQHSQPPTTCKNDIYEIPDGKPIVRPVPPTKVVVPAWLNQSVPLHIVADENQKPAAAEYIENVLLPTRAAKDEESKNFIETLKRKLSQKNLLAVVKNCDNKPIQKNNTNNNAIVTTNNNLNNHASVEHVKNSVDYGNKIKQIKESLQKYPWFYRVDRSKAELILENYNSDGSFLVRECHHGGPNVPFTLTLRYNGRLFHIQIRLRQDFRFALGTLKLNEMHFGSVAEMVDTYKKTYLQLHSNGKFFGETKLTQPPIVYSFSNNK